MDLEPEQALARALVATRQLLALVKSGEMQQAAKLEAQRLRLIRQGLADDSEGSPESCIEILREIQALDQEIGSVGRQERETLAQQLRGFSQGRKAERAYRQGR